MVPMKCTQKIRVFIKRGYYNNMSRFGLIIRLWWTSQTVQYSVMNCKNKGIPIVNKYWRNDYSGKKVGATHLRGCGWALAATSRVDRMRRLARREQEKRVYLSVHLAEWPKGILCRSQANCKKSGAKGRVNSFEWKRYGRNLFGEKKWWEREDLSNKCTKNMGTREQVTITR